MRLNADPLHVLRARTSAKWSSFPDDVLPMFVAEMDFPLAPAISTALHQAIERGDTGYVNPRGSGVPEAFVDYTKQAWAWAPDTDAMGITTDVSVVIVESLRRLISPGQGVIITPPVYPPFFDLLPEGGAAVVEVPLRDDSSSYALDLDGIDRALHEGARGVLLCNPHNPVGLVHSREDLVQLSQIVARHDGFVISDEIHGPLIHDGHEFTPYLTASAEAREHGIAAHSASKAFNLAGLKCALFVAESDRMTSLITSLPEEVGYRAGLFGAIASRAGFADGRDWLTGTLTAIEQNLDLLQELLKRHLPMVKLRRPNASFLAWIDMSNLGWGDDPAKYALDAARVALSHGPLFGPQGAGYARINIACAPDMITEAIARLSRADAAFTET